MSSACPNGHQSDWEDWCSVCGERLAGATPAAAPAATPDANGPDPNTNPTPDANGPDPNTNATPDANAPDPTTNPTPDASGPTCANCGAGRRAQDVFCESCGYDFASGSLPEDPTPPDPGVGVGVAAVHARVSVDPDFYAASVGDVDLALPDPLPDPQIVPLPGIRILVGRQSTSRGIFPEIDVRELTADPAVSSRHAMLERDTGGNWTLTDLGSTNGTFLSPSADPAIPTGTALPLPIGTKVYLGAWSSIELAES